jgi:hypothetical protein
MRLFSILVLVYPAAVAANIHFSFIPPSCNNPTDCLSGQTCTHDHKCDPIKTDLLVTEASPPRSDGRCGRGFNNATCDADAPYGPCCSSHDYCGKTKEHCLISNGCQSGCTGGVPSSSSLKLHLLTSQLFQGLQPVSQPLQVELSLLMVLVAPHMEARSAQIRNLEAAAQRTCDTSAAR